MSNEETSGGGTTLTIGEMADVSGLTPRTLRFWEQRGLVSQPGRTHGGHRLYGDTHVAEIYRIQMLRGLGLSVDETAQALADPEVDLSATIHAHLAELDAQIAARTQLRSRLRTLNDAGDQAAGINTNELLTVMEEMTHMQTTINERISILIYEDIEAASSG